MTTKLTRPSNKPRAEIIALAEKTIAQNGGPDLARVFYKFDCGHCGLRRTVEDPGILPEEGVCTICGHRTPILGAGFQLQMRRSASIPWDGRTLFISRKYEAEK